MYKDRFAYEIEVKDFYRDIAKGKDVETKFDTSGYLEDDNMPLPMGRDQKVIGMIKNEISGKTMTEFVALRAKTYTHRKQDSLEAQREHEKLEDKCCKGTKSVQSPQILTFDDYKTCLFKGKKYT